MRRNLTLDLSKTAPFLKENELDYMEDLVKAAHEKIHNKTGAGNDFLGWVDLPINYDKAEFERINKEKPVEGSPLFLLQMCTEQLVESGKFDMRQDGA